MTWILLFAGLFAAAFAALVAGTAALTLRIAWPFWRSRSGCCCS